MAWTLSLVPLLAAALVVGLRRAPRASAPIAVGGLIATIPLAVWAAAAKASATWGWGPRLGLQLAVVGFSRVMVVLVPTVATAVVVYAAATEKEGRTRLLAALAAFVGVMELLVTAADFLTLLIGWELVGALSWMLIGHGWRDPDNPRAAAQAFITTRVGDLGLYLAAGTTFAATGSFSFSALPGASGVRLDVIAAGVLLAAAAKSAQVPFSPWLMSAMAGPTPVSALLHSSTMVAAGAYLLIRLAPALQAAGWFGPAVGALGLATAVAGGAIAALQTHGKRILAGSTSAQYGLMLAAVGAGSTAAAGAQLVTHAFFKSLLFLSAGIAMHAVGTGDVRRMRLGSVLPVASTLAAFGALALAAVPPLGGAWSKEEIVAAVAGSLNDLPALTVFVAAFLSAVYASRFWLLTWGPGSPVEVMVGNPVPQLVRARPRRELDHRPTTAELGSLAFLAAGTLALGLLWLPGGGRLVETVTSGELPKGAAVVVHRFHEQLISLGLIAAAFGLVALLWRRARLPTFGLSPGVQAWMADWLGIPVAARLVVVDPVLRLSRVLARFDDRVIDAGVRGAAAIASFLSRILGWRGELTIDGVVRAVAGATMRAAAGSRVSDERVVDGAVEGLAQEIGVAGHSSRKLQTGLSHHYFVIVAVGSAVVVAVLALIR